MKISQLKLRSEKFDDDDDDDNNNNNNNNVLAFTRVDAEYPDGLERTDDAYPEADHVGD